jgi:hypothetical protein
MEDAREDRLNMLCTRAANEHNLQKLLEIVQEINKLLEAKRNRQTRTNGEK